MKKWTKDEILFLRTELENGKSFSNISQSLNRSYNSCAVKSQKLRLKNYYKNRLYHQNEDFWKIPNLLNSFYAGFISADGSISKITNTLSIEISKNDLNFLQVFKEKVCFSGPIKEYRNETKSPTVKISINSRNWKQNLNNNFNIINNKTKRLSPPTLLPKLLFFSWLNGYYCGDGAVFVSNNMLFLTVTSSSMGCVEFICDFLKKEFPFKIDYGKKIVKSNLSYEILSNVNCYRLTITGLRAATIIDYLRQFPVPHLARKWDNPLVLQKISDYKLKYPHLFKVLDQEKLKEIS